MDEVFGLVGPVEEVDGELCLMIPMDQGGEIFQKVATSTVEGEFLKISIKPWLAEHLGIQAGSYVAIDNENGKFNITKAEPPEEEYGTLTGPVSLLDGRLVLIIHLAAGADKFVDCTRGFSEVLEEYLVIDINAEAARDLELAEGTLVTIGNDDDKFTITLAERNC